jgi:hypothetical protein
VIVTRTNAHPPGIPEQFLRGKRKLSFKPTLDVSQALAGFQIRKCKRKIRALRTSVARHDIERSTHIRGQVHFVDHQKIGPTNPRATFARYLIASRQIDHVDEDVDKVGTESGSEIVAPALDQYELQTSERGLEARRTSPPATTSGRFSESAPYEGRTGNGTEEPSARRTTQRGKGHERRV